MTAILLPNGKQQFIDINGKPLVAGTVGMYAPATLTPKNTWQDAGQTVLNTNPIVLDSRGQALIYGNGTYRQIVKDSLGNLIWDETTSALYPLPILTPQMFGAVGDGVVDDTTAFNNWLAAIEGAAGYIPTPSVSYNIPNGLTISGHVNTTITSDVGAIISCLSMVSGYAVTMTNCIECNFRFPVIQAGYSGILLTSTASNIILNKIYVERLSGATALQASKPSDPMAHTVGINILGPTVGNTNYFNIIMPGTYITGFDTGLAFYTPTSVGAMNSNGNKAIAVEFENYWFGFYTNSAENQCTNCGWFDTTRGSGGSNAECIRIGDGTYATEFNTVNGCAEPSGAHVQGVNCLANSLNNKITIQDNCSQGSTDSGANDLITHNTWNINSQVNIEGSPVFKNSTGLTAGGVNGIGFGTGGAINIFFGSGVPTNTAPQGSLYLRSDGSSTSTRAYINTNGSTGWTAITTAS